GSAPANLYEHVADAADVVAMASDGLRPKAEGAARFASPPGIERDIGVLEIADEIIPDRQIALIDRRDETQFVHIFKNGPRRIVPQRAGGIAIGQSRDHAPIALAGDLLDGEIELVAGDEIDCRR